MSLHQFAVLQCPCDDCKLVASRFTEMVTALPEMCASSMCNGIAQQLGVLIGCSLLPGAPLDPLLKRLLHQVEQNARVAYARVEAAEGEG